MSHNTFKHRYKNQLLLVWGKTEVKTLLYSYATQKYIFLLISYSNNISHMPCNKTNKKEHIDLGFNFMQYFKFLVIFLSYNICHAV